jgi:hypothetical protein
MASYPLSGELSRRRLGTESGALRREARAIARAGGNPQRFLEAAGQAKLSEGGAISSAAENRAKQELGIRAQRELAREQDGLVKEMRGGTTGGVLRSAASGTNSTGSGMNPPTSGTNAPMKLDFVEPVGAMQSVAAPPVNQAKADIAEVGLDEAIKRYYQRSADAEKVRSEKGTLAQMEAAGAESSGVPRSNGIPAISAPYQAPAERPELAAALQESAATKERVAARRAGTLQEPAVETASATPAPAAPAPTPSSLPSRIGSTLGQIAGAYTPSNIADTASALKKRSQGAALKGFLQANVSAKQAAGGVGSAAISTVNRTNRSLREFAKSFNESF